ncbi:MAG: CoA-binding protein [Candidatus Lokiarchaeota archaeon]|nr:CoA-binding protein [Candidatus Lokiarchaeota archaeon]
MVEPTHFLHKLLNPQSLCVFGANENLLQNMGCQELLNILDDGYKGNVYPIHPRLETVLGLKAYKTIAELPETPDLAIILLPKRIVPQILREIGEKGTKFVILVTAGFRETDNAEAEEEIVKIAQQYGMRFIGPNCLGIINTHCKVGDEECILNTTWVNYYEPNRPGNVSIASQSGTFVSHVCFLTPEIDLHFSKTISIGNSLNVDIIDCLEYFEQDPTTDVILLYIEEIQRGREFIEAVKRIAPKKPIIALYTGGSKYGAKAVASHTGSLSGNDDIYNAAFKYGIIRVDTLEEWLDTAVLFSKTIPIGAIPKNNRLGIVTVAGGPGATMSDQASREGLIMPELPKDVQEKVKTMLPATAQGIQASNPIDFTFQISPQVFFERMPKLIAKKDIVDGMILFGAYGRDFFQYHEIGMSFYRTEAVQNGLDVLKELTEAGIEYLKRMVKKLKVPIIFVNYLGTKDEVVNLLNSKGFTVFRLEHQAVHAMKNLMAYGIFLQKLYSSSN